MGQAQLERLLAVAGIDSGRCSCFTVIAKPDLGKDWKNGMAETLAESGISRQSLHPKGVWPQRGEYTMSCEQQILIERQLLGYNNMSQKVVKGGDSSQDRNGSVALFGGQKSI